MYCDTPQHIFSDYFRILSSLKLRFEPIGKEHIDNVPKYLESINTTMKFVEEGVKLTTENCVPNPSLRQFIKQMMNSCIGKLGQKSTGRVTTLFLYDQTELALLYYSPNVEILNIHLINENCLQVQLRYKKEMQKVSRTQNVTLASYVTCYARLKLDKLFRTLLSKNCQLLYHDTDS